MEQPKNEEEERDLELKPEGSRATRKSGPFYPQDKEVNELSDLFANTTKLHETTIIIPKKQKQKYGKVKASGRGTARLIKPYDSEMKMDYRKGGKRRTKRRCRKSKRVKRKH